MKRRRILGFIAVALLIVVGSFGAVRAQQWRLEQLDYAAPEPGMVLIPAGEFYVGTTHAKAGDDEGTLASKFVPAFYIDVHEVTNAQYKAFDPTHEYAGGRDDFPVVRKSIDEARAYAASVGKRLPTLEEWEKAARGTDTRDYTWGDAYKDGIANLGNQDDLSPVGSHPQSVSPYGVHDMIGNAWEWVDGRYEDGGYLTTGTKPVVRDIIKGGAYAYSPNQGRITYNGYEAVGTTCHDISFRCAQDAQVAD